MLVDVKHRKDLIDEIISPEIETDRREKGVYITHINFDNDIINEHNNYPIIFEDGRVYDKYKDLPKNWFKLPHIPEYGVCDTPDQFMHKYRKILESSDEMFCVAFAIIKKSDQPEHGGWRWHKWGTYIGDKNPQHEYLYDEIGINEVYCYHVFHILEN